MNPKKSNSGFLVVLLILVIGAYYFISVFQPGSGDYTYQQFMKDVKSDKVTAVTIKQNKEVPTGTITAEFGKMIIRAVKLQMSIRRSMILRKLTALLPIRSVLRESITVGI